MALTVSCPVALVVVASKLYRQWCPCGFGNRMRHVVHPGLGIWHALELCNAQRIKSQMWWQTTHTSSIVQGDTSSISASSSQCFWTGHWRGAHQCHFALRLSLPSLGLVLTQRGHCLCRTR